MLEWRSFWRRSSRERRRWGRNALPLYKKNKKEQRHRSHKNRFSCYRKLVNRRALQNTDMSCIVFLLAPHSFIHSDYFYSASSSPLLLRGAPDTARTLCLSFTPKRHRQLRVKGLTKVPTWQLEWDSNHRPSDERRRIYQWSTTPHMYQTFERSHTIIKQITPESYMRGRQMNCTSIGSAFLTHVHTRKPFKIAP